ncbi:E3 ubiquitin-protein ligase SGR9 [Nymphaea thermarum]|nr:E3 ubiquitin-protein ligase SGR9 [Nymphaea thermarum]
MSSISDTIMRAMENSGGRPSSETLKLAAGEARFHFQRLCFLLLSPYHFARTFRHLQSLSFEQKTVMVGRTLLGLLRKLASWSEFEPRVQTAGGGGGGAGCGLRDFDAGILLLLIFEVFEQDEESDLVGGRNLTSPADWQGRLREQCAPNVLSLGGFGLDYWSVLRWYVDVVGRYERVWRASVGLLGNGGGGEKAVRSAPASVATVVSLEEVAVVEEGEECVVCWEEMGGWAGGGCRLACGHVFHVGCIVGWLKKASTCPVCRFELPTDDVALEIDRLRRVLADRSHHTCLS